MSANSLARLRTTGWSWPQIVVKAGLYAGINSQKRQNRQQRHTATLWKVRTAWSAAVAAGIGLSVAGISMERLCCAIT
jgi:hypothetical protein